MKPFNLEAAKSGAPIVTRDGREAKFVAHVPEANENEKIVVLIGKQIFLYSDNGSYLFDTESNRDLFMKPQKRFEYANIFQDGNNKRWVSYQTEEEAKKYAIQQLGIQYVAIAVPIEIEE